MDTIIRYAKTEELKAVQDLNFSLFTAENSNDELLDMDWPYNEGERYFKNLISGECGVCFVAELEGELVGYIAGSITDTNGYRPVKRSELENMFVKEPFRGNGIGDKLAKVFLNWSKNNGAQRCFVVAYTQNARAMEFYLKAGFSPYSSELEVQLD